MQVQSTYAPKLRAGTIPARYTGCSIGGTLTSVWAADPFKMKILNTQKRLPSHQQYNQWQPLCVANHCPTLVMLAQSQQEWHELTHLTDTLSTHETPPSTYSASPTVLSITVRYTSHAGTMTAGKA